MWRLYVWRNLCRLSLGLDLGLSLSRFCVIANRDHFFAVVHLYSDVITPTHSRWLKIATANQSSIPHGSGAAVIVPQTVKELAKVHKVLAFRTKLNDMPLNNTSWKSW